MYRSVLLLALFAFLIPIARKLLLLLLAFFFFCRLELLKKFRIYRIPYHDGQVWAEARAGTINFVIDIALLLAITAAGWIPLAKFTILNTVATYVAMFVWFEFWFYGTHRLYHRKEFYFVHEQHHRSQVTSPWSAFSFSILERMSLNVGTFGFAIVYSHVMPFSAPAFLLYCVSSNLFNVLLHSNVEVFPAGFTRNRYLNWIFTPTFHALHHARYQQHYGLFTTIPDRLFNTLWADYDQVHERVARGEGMNAFHERGPGSKPPVNVPAAETAPALVAPSEAMPVV